MGTAECMNSVRSWARVGAALAPSSASSVPLVAAFEPLAITPLVPEICTASDVFADANRTQTAGGR